MLQGSRSLDPGGSVEIYGRIFADGHLFSNDSINLGSTAAFGPDVSTGSTGL